MIVQFIFFLTMYPVLFILYFCMRNEGMRSDGFSFGIRMKPEWQNDAAVRRADETYRRRLKKLTVILAILPLTTFFIPYFSVSFSIWTLWITAICFAPAFPFARGYREIRSLKQQKNWQNQNRGCSFTEIRNAGQVRCAKSAEFLPPVLLGAAIAVYSLYRAAAQDRIKAGLLTAFFATLTGFLYAVAIWTDRQKTEVICSDSEINLNYSRARKHIWKNMWLAAVWLNTAFPALLAVVLTWDDNTSYILWSCIIYTVASLLLSFGALKKMKEVSRLYAPLKESPLEDDDSHWLLGMFYYNSNDRHVLVSKRVGIGTTMNLATPFGMGFTVFGCLCLLIIPVSCVWMIMEEFTPIRLSVENDLLTAEHIRVEYEIPLSGIEEITLTGETPRWSRQNGTGMENLNKGTFHIRNVGNCEVLLNPQNQIFLRIETEDETYYMSSADDAETRKIYGQITRALP